MKPETQVERLAQAFHNFRQHIAAVLCETRGHTGRRPCDFCLNVSCFVDEEALRESAPSAAPIGEHQWGCPSFSSGDESECDCKKLGLADALRIAGQAQGRATPEQPVASPSELACKTADEWFRAHSAPSWRLAEIIELALLEARREEARWWSTLGDNYGQDEIEDVERRRLAELDRAIGAAKGK